MKCPNCGGEGPHFVPPSMGEPGFFYCDYVGDEMIEQEGVTRVEVIDHRKSSQNPGRIFSAWGVAVMLSYQDGDRTLKVFVYDSAGLEDSPIDSTAPDS